MTKQRAAQKAKIDRQGGADVRCITAEMVFGTALALVAEAGVDVRVAEAVG